MANAAEASTLLIALVIIKSPFRLISHPFQMIVLSVIRFGRLLPGGLSR
jgi:hypothetical protein